MSDPDLLVYYAARAAEYEKVYEKSERQADLVRLHETVPAFFDDRRVLDDLPRFLEGLHRRLEPSSLVVLVDNNYVEGSNYRISRTDDGGNTYQRRRLEDGSEYEVLKNFPTESELRDAIEASGGTHVRILELDHYWCATYTSSSRA